MNVAAIVAAKRLGNYTVRAVASEQFVDYFFLLVDFVGIRAVETLKPAACFDEALVELVTICIVYFSTKHFIPFGFEVRHYVFPLVCYPTMAMRMLSAIR